MKIYLLTRYYRNYEDYEDKYEDEIHLKAFLDLEDAMSYGNKKFQKSTESDIEVWGYSYVSENEEMEDAYLNYRIYELELQE